jgi:hypothetical protein
MDIKDYIGERGELIFAYLITKWCQGKPWFQQQFSGAKAEVKDFSISLINPSSKEATFFVQVKSTTQGYQGRGANRKLKVRVHKSDVAKLRNAPGPAYIAGIDIHKECGFIMAVTDKLVRGVSGMPVTYPIDCTTIPALWTEVDTYWAKRNMLAKKSLFS